MPTSRYYNRSRFMGSSLANRNWCASVSYSIKQNVIYSLVMTVHYFACLNCTDRSVFCSMFIVVRWLTASWYRGGHAFVVGFADPIVGNIFFYTYYVCSYQLTGDLCVCSRRAMHRLVYTRSLLLYSSRDSITTPWPSSHRSCDVISSCVNLTKVIHWSRM